MKDIKSIIKLLSHTFQYLDRHPEIVNEIIKEYSDIQTEPNNPDNNDSDSTSINNIDIYEIYKKMGAEGLKDKLNDLQIDELKEIIKTHRLDPKKYFYKWKTTEKFINFIIEKVKYKIDKGKTFIAEDSTLKQNENINSPNK
jgi:hypothetical protein